MATASVRQAVEEARSNLSAPNPAGHSQFIKDPLAHFKSMPWCAELLSDPMILETVVPDRRTLPSGQYNFVRRVMSGATTVRACVSFVQRLQQQQSGAGGDGERVEGKAVSASKPLLQGGGPADGEDARNPFLLFNALLDLGEDLCSYPNTLHGGLFVVLMDEVMSTAANIQTSESFSFPKVKWILFSFRRKYWRSRHGLTSKTNHAAAFFPRANRTRGAHGPVQHYLPQGRQDAAGRAGPRPRGQARRPQDYRAGID